MSEPSEAYNQGYEAARNGLPDSQCPYPAESVEEGEWATGWINFHRDNPPKRKAGGCGCNK